MEIKEAEEKDIPEIVGVLKASLGETDLPLSEEIWIYKHITNPYGKSLVLVAKENGVIIGVRAFMRWNWQKGGNIYSAFRAVDTATHPHHQGKGIFKKLTLKAVELARNKEDHFIFNTPNEKSRPGYLKMGWEVVSKVQVGIKPSLYSFWRFKKRIEYKMKIQATDEEIDFLCSNWNKRLQESSNIYTPKNRSYLKWRFENNMLQKYEVIASPNLYIAACVKNRGRIKELRISECIYSNWQKEKQNIIKIINTIAWKAGVQFISFSPFLLDGGWLSSRGFYGPVLTIKKLNLNSAMEKNLLEIGNWRNSLGDLELF